MKFILIGKEAHTMPYAIELSATSVQSALDEAGGFDKNRNFFQPLFWVDVEAGAVSRVVRGKDRKFVLAGEAFNQNLGTDTPPAFFLNEKVEIEKPTTQEIAE